jgi:putative selenium metabolism hydrolase
LPSRENPASGSSSAAWQEILDHTQQQSAALTQFLHDIVAIPSPSGNEQAVVRRVEAEMLAVGFDEVKVDPFGNVHGRIGSGPRVVAFDAHLDTVDVGDRDQWSCDPFGGELRESCLYGRGAVDQKAGMAGMVYAGKLIKQLNLAPDCQVWMVGSVMEEDCDGLCWHYILQEKVLAPEVVVSTEPTNLHIHRGQRGRMNILVETTGRSSHGSMPQLGENAITKLAPAFAALADLNHHLADDAFLGAGSCAVTWIGSKAASLNAVPHRASLHIDRRLTTGETKESALQEVQSVLTKVGVDARVWIPDFETPTWTGLQYPMAQYYPTWSVPENHAAVQAALAAGRGLWGQELVVGRWNFSTNGVVINGLHGVPCLGFGPGREEVAHTRDEYVPVEDVVRACAFYAAFPAAFCQTTTSP